MDYDCEELKVKSRIVCNAIDDLDWDDMLNMKVEVIFKLYNWLERKGHVRSVK